MPSFGRAALNRVNRVVRGNPVATALVITSVVALVVALVVGRWRGAEGLAINPVVGVPPNFDELNRTPAPAGKVLLYHDAYFLKPFSWGGAIQFGPGRMPLIPSDKLTSIKVGQGVVVTLYQHANFGGRSLTLGPGNYPNLGWFAFGTFEGGPHGRNQYFWENEYYPWPQQGYNLCSGKTVFMTYKVNKNCWNDSVSSMIIFPQGPAKPVAVYDTTGFKMSRGVPGQFSPGIHLQLSKWGWEDRIASVDVPPGHVLTLFEHANLTGKRLQLTAGRHDLSRYRFGNNTPLQNTNVCDNKGRGCWSRIASSLRVEPRAF